MIEINRIEPDAQAHKVKKRTDPFAKMAKAIREMVDAGYPVKVDYQPPAPPTGATALDEWKRSRARQS